MLKHMIGRLGGLAFSGFLVLWSLLPASASAATYGVATTHIQHHAPKPQSVTRHTAKPVEHFVVHIQRTALTAAQASYLDSPAGPKVIKGNISTGTPYTIYTVQFIGPNGKPSVSPTHAIVIVQDNNGSLATPGGLVYMAYHGGEKNPFQGDATVYNQRTLRASAHFQLPIVNGRGQFAVLNGYTASQPVAISIIDPVQHQHVVEMYHTLVGPAYGAIPLGFADVTLVPGQTASLTFLATDAAANPVGAGVPVHLFLTAGRSGAMVPAGVTLDGQNATAAAPITEMTNRLGEVSVVLANPADSSQTTYYLNARVASNPVVFPVGITDIPVANEVQALGLSTTSVLAGTAATPAPVVIPTSITLPVGSVLDASAFGGTTGGPIYIEGLNTSSGTNVAVNGVGANPMATLAHAPLTTGDDVVAASLNPNIVSVSGWHNVANGETQLQSGVTTLPTITAKTVGTTEIVIVDISNPSLPKLTLAIHVVPAGTSSP